MGILNRYFMKLTTVFCAFAAILFTAAEARAQSREYELKAVFLFNFSQFVKWPPDALPAGTPFTIGIMGDDPFGAALEKAVQGESAAGRKIAIRRVRSADEAKSCQIVFISKGGGSAGSAANRGTLTVTDGTRGGMIDFHVEGNNVAFSINADAAKRADLTISPKLLRLAK